MSDSALPNPLSEPAVKVLIVDDDPSARGFYQRLLELSGFASAVAENGVEAEKRLATASFDVILSDITMPEMNGIELLRSVRRHDLDVPVILVTGNPNVETAAKAVEHGALRYLMKPVANDDLCESVQYAATVSKLARARRRALEKIGHGGAADQAGLQLSFTRALDKLWMAFQPIVSHTRRDIYAYEALLRSDDPALPHPGVLLDAAERLGRVHDLGRAVRNTVATVIDRQAGPTLFFVNLHPHDLGDEALYDGRAPLSRHARRVVLEVTERAHLDKFTDLDARLTALHALGFRIALDDLGAGYAGLNSFVRLKPDVVKIDMELVRDIQHDTTRRELVRSVHALCGTLGTAVVAEGVEHPDEYATLAALGLDLLQGYVFARPNRELMGVPAERFASAA